MNANFSAFNVEYFLALREISKQSPAIAAALFGVSPGFLEPVSRLSPHQLAHLSHIMVPLVVPRHEPVWWPRLLEALADGNRAAVMALAEEASYYFVRPGCLTMQHRVEDGLKVASAREVSSAPELKPTA